MKITKEQFEIFDQAFNNDETALCYGMRFCKHFDIGYDSIFFETDNVKARDYIIINYVPDFWKR